jgi:glycosyltransferase involved in cell wall biosynthesis
VEGSFGAERVHDMTGGKVPPARLRVALDATPLLGQPTGVGVFCLGALTALGGRTDLDTRAFAVSWRRRAGIEAKVPGGVTVAQRAMPARPLHAIWGHADVPPVEWFIGPVDVVHGTNFVVPPTSRAAAIVSVHDLTPLHHPELCNQATLAYPELIRRALRRGAWVHADSAFVAGEVMEAFGAEPSRVRVVAPGVPPLPEVDLDLTRSLVEPYLPPGVTRYVLAIGTAEPRKDLPGLVRAFDRLADRQVDLALVLAGPPGWGEEALASAIGQARSGARVVRTGWVEPATLAALLREASVLAFPSLYEGFGFPPLQAMAAGIPVVATRAGSLPEVLGDGAAMVDVGDADGLVGAIARVLDDPVLRQSLVAAGSARAASFSWERCGAELAQLYQDAAEARGG